MKVEALKAFKHSHDGVKAEEAAAGDTPDVLAELVPGLERAGYVRRLPDEPAEDPDDIGGPPEIPEGWADLHHSKLVALANALGGDVKKKADAVEIIEAEIERRAAP